jgi:hypothetical protein
VSGRRLNVGYLAEIARRFPLYSKGVDTYRYEYGVFLLNKDIELVRSDFRFEGVEILITYS